MIGAPPVFSGEALVRIGHQVPARSRAQRGAARGLYTNTLLVPAGSRAPFANRNSLSRAGGRLLAGVFG